MKRPAAAFGVAWGATLDEAGRTLGVSCEQSYPWREASAFEVCRGRASLLGVAAWIELVTQHERFAGMFATFTNTPCGQLAARLRQELALPDDADPVSVSWRSGEMIRLEETAAGCMLTVAGPGLGTELQREQLASGLASLAGGLRP